MSRTPARVSLLAVLAAVLVALALRAAFLSGEVPRSFNGLLSLTGAVWVAAVMQRRDPATPSGSGVSVRAQVGNNRRNRRPDGLL